MQEIRVVYNFKAGQEKVFAGLSDHVSFLSTSRIHCVMKRTGAPDPNGNGAVRVVRNGKLCFEEEISAFNAPHSYQYRIISLRGPFNLKLPLHHEFGHLELHRLDQETQLVWTSRFYFSVPLINRWIEKKLGHSISATFLFFLKRLEVRLADASGRA